jgi:two-component system nitrate/nitrite response regulator NarL
MRIVIADDHALFRESLKSALALQPGVQVVAEVGCVDDLLPMLARTPCDILLLDLQMDRNALSEIPALAQKTAVVVVTASEGPEDALAAIRAGARGVIFKRFAVEDLMRAMRTVAEGNAWMPASVQAFLAAGLRAPVGEALTQREREIVRHVALGLRSAEVARKLFISEQTVKTHLNNVFRKLGVRDRVELALYAARVGIIGVREQRP